MQQDGLSLVGKFMKHSLRFPWLVCLKVCPSCYYKKFEPWKGSTFFWHALVYCNFHREVRLGGWAWSLSVWRWGKSVHKSWLHWHSARWSPWSLWHSAWLSSWLLWWTTWLSAQVLVIPNCRNKMQACNFLLNLFSIFRWQIHLVRIGKDCHLSAHRGQWLCTRVYSIPWWGSWRLLWVAI